VRRSLRPVIEPAQCSHVCSRRSEPELVEATAVPVLQAALPFLSRLERPAVRVTDNTLQVRRRPDA
jgi:hypothetical protein